jgi:hypothetical protein
MGMKWESIETLEPNVTVLVWRPYETDGKQFAIDSFRWRETYGWDVKSETRNAKGIRQIRQQKIERDREWNQDGWGATHWSPLPDPPVTNGDGT